MSFKTTLNRDANMSVDSPHLISGVYRLEQEYYSVASVCHLMLFGKPLEIDRGARITLRLPLKSYWNSVWEDVFDKLLNGSMDGLIEKLRASISETDQGMRSLKALLFSIEESR